MSGEALYTVRSRYAPQMFWEAAKRFKRGLFVGMRVFFAAVSVIGLVCFLLLLWKAALAGIIAAAVTAFAIYKLFTFEKTLRKKFVAAVRRPEGERELCLYDTYFECIGQGEERRVEYSALMSIYESESGLFIQSRASVDFIDRTLCTPDEFETIRGFLQDKLNGQVTSL